jgi:heavy metal sensor kinase
LGIGLLFRQTLSANLERQTRDLLDQEWATVRGYLRIESGRPFWYYDRMDPDETYIVSRLQRVYLLADAQGDPVESSEIYRAIGIEPPERIRELMRLNGPSWRTRTGASGTAYLIRSGIVFDEKHSQPYFVAIGRSLSDNRRVVEGFTFTYAVMVPFMILAGCLLGWFLAGRALEPVLDVARTAQRISGSNLSLRIASREAGDELDNLIETFNQMIQRLENSFHQSRQFSTDVSHELRTPLTALRGQLEVALFTAETTEQYREAILDSLQDIERLSQIVRALLQLSQAESGQLTLQKESLDLAQLAGQVAEQYQILADEAGVRLAVEARPTMADADRVQIERLVANLLSNALKFTPAGGEVRVSTSAADDGAELRVEDTGRGISPEHLPNIFDRFYRVPGENAVAPEPGLGLGLSFVAWIVRAHGGRIDVDSKPGKGTRFTVRLPQPAPDAHAHSAAPAMKEV